MRTFLFLTLQILILLAPPAHATLYKCVDAAGKVTYTNLPCEQSGLKETTVIAPPPPPAEAAAIKPAPAAEAKPVEHHPAAPEGKGSSSIQVIRSQETNGKKCENLNEAQGKVMDEMDAARRKGYTTQQEAVWNDKLRKLQAEKNKLGCF
jgi:Domain of unknown function (DUF4124)